MFSTLTRICIQVYSISKDSALCLWTASHNPEELETKHEVRKRKLENTEEESDDEGKIND